MEPHAADLLAHNDDQLALPNSYRTSAVFIDSSDWRGPMARLSPLWRAGGLRAPSTLPTSVIGICRPGRCRTLRSRWRADRSVLEDRRNPDRRYSHAVRLSERRQRGEAALRD